MGWAGAGRAAKRGKLAKKHRRWMSLLKQELIQAIREQRRAVWEEEATCVSLMALNTQVFRDGQSYT